MSCSLEQDDKTTNVYAGQMTRALGVVRLSRLTDETTSPARQREQVENSTRTLDGRVVHWAEDLDVSASKFSPFDRPQLRPYLTDPQLIDSFDVLVFWRLDRFVRSAKDFRDVLNWADKHNKILMSATETIKYDPNATGLDRVISEIVLTVTAGMAQIEVYNTSVRVSETRAWLRRGGYYHGGSIPLGYKPAQHPEDEKRLTLVHSELTYPIRREIIEMILARKTKTQMVNHFNKIGTPSPENLERIVRGKEPRTKKDGGPLLWHYQSFRRMFADETPLGYMMLNRKPVLDEKTGLPIQAYPPLMTKAELSEVQRILSKPSPSSNTDFPLTGLVYCLECGRVRHHARQRYETYHVDYLRCPNKVAPRGHEQEPCNAPSVRVDELLPKVDSKFMEHYHDEPYTRLVYQAGEDYTEELATAKQSLEQVLSMLPTIKSDTAKAVFAQQISALEETISALEAKPNRPSTYVPERDGETYGDKWTRMDWPERADLLRECHFQIYTTKRDKLQVRVSSSL